MNERKTEGELMILAGKGNIAAKRELESRWNERKRQYEEWRRQNPGCSAAVAFSR